MNRIPLALLAVLLTATLPACKIVKTDAGGTAANSAGEAGDDARIAALLAPIHHAPTGARLACERAFLLTLDGSCETPIAGLAVAEGDALWLRGEILRPDGSERIADAIRGPATAGAALGVELARRLLARAPGGFFCWR